MAARSVVEPPCWEAAAILGTDHGCECHHDGRGPPEILAWWAFDTILLIAVNAIMVGVRYLDCCVSSWWAFVTILMIAVMAIMVGAAVIVIHVESPTCNSQFQKPCTYHS